MNKPINPVYNLIETFIDNPRISLAPRALGYIIYHASKVGYKNRDVWIELENQLSR